MEYTKINQFLSTNHLIIKRLAQKFSIESSKNGYELNFKESAEYFNFVIQNSPRKSIVTSINEYFQNLIFEEPTEHNDYISDVDYICKISETKAFGIQIKPATAKSNFGNYSLSERMKASFNDFTNDFGGKVFIIYSLDGEVANLEVLKEIENEIDRLKLL